MRWLVLLLGLCGAASATTTFISQSGGSVSCGADGTQTTQAYTFTAYSAGDTLKLCGTINGPNTATSTVFTIQQNNVTMIWESNASISVPACAVQSSGGCINTNGKTGLTFNGQCTTFVDTDGYTRCSESTSNSIIATANGTGLAHQNESQGIVGSGCTNCIFENLDIEGMYVKSGNDTAPAAFPHDPSGIYVQGTGMTMTTITVNNANHGATDAYANGDTNVTYDSWLVDNVNQGISIGNNNTNAITNFIIRKVHAKSCANWDDTTDDYHHDCIAFLFQDNVAGSITNVYIYDNLGDGDIGANATAWVYFNSGMHNVYVFNNKFFNPGSRGVAMLEDGFSGDTNSFIANNYFDCGGTSNGSRATQLTAVTNVTLEDNAFHNCNVYNLWNGITIGTGTVDHNAYESACTGSACFGLSGSNNNTFAQWKSGCSCDSASIVPASVNATSTGFPNSGSPMIHDGTTNFANISASCSGTLAALCTDFAGVARPPSGTDNWDAGAYMFQAVFIQSGAVSNGAKLSNGAVIK